MTTTVITETHFIVFYNIKMCLYSDSRIYIKMGVQKSIQLNNFPLIIAPKTHHNYKQLSNYFDMIRNNFNIFIIDG